ncbi:MAG TPA: DUF2142 domain-containing protein [Actinomycetota bacterium]|nr:DUF2142 domain-containing protein [Actinomycetota bacterium]
MMTEDVRERASEAGAETAATPEARESPSWAPRSKRTLLNGILVVAALLVTGLCWAVASPVGSSPDDDFHLTSIWCLTAGPDSKCPTKYFIDGTPAVETFVSLQKACYAGSPALPASCQKLGDQLAFSDRVNDGGYPGGFYRVMNLFASDKLIWSVLLMRLVNFALFSGLVGATFWLASARVRRAIALTLPVTLIPVGLFLVASTNPSSWTVTGIAVLFFALIALSDTEGAARAGTLAGLAAIGGGMAAASRGDGAAYAVAVSVLAGWLGFPGLRKRPWRFGALVLPIATGGYAYLTATQVAAYGDSTLGADWLIPNLLDVVSIPLGNLGLGTLGSLGWLDTAAPALTWAAMALALSVVLFFGVSELGWHFGLGAAGAATLMLGLPLYMLQKYGYRVGEFVQPRYMLPLLIATVGTVALAAVKRPRSTPQGWMLIAGSVSIAHAAMLYTNLLRYSNGAASVYPLGMNTQWWWTASTSPLLVFVVGSVAFAAFLVLLFRSLVANGAVDAPVVRPGLRESWGAK